MLRRIHSLSKEDRGFTLIELMVVVIIIAVLAAIAIPLYTGYIKNARTSEGIARLGSIMTASKAYYQRYDNWPPSVPGPGVPGYYADFGDSEHFRYSITAGAGGQGAFTVQADGLDVDGMLGVTITMTCASAREEGVVDVTGI
jgi:type IV pilus assembly protein PilE